MKKILLGIAVALLSLASYAQSLENMIVEQIPVSAGAIAQDPNLNSNSVTYRIFIDMAAGSYMESVLGTTLNPLVIETSTQWYNDGNAGAIFPFGSDFRNHPSTTAPAFTMDDPQYYDSWVTIGSYGDLSRATSRAQLVPRAEDTDGVADGIVLSPLQPEATLDPATDFSPNFGFEMGSSFVSENVIWYAAGGVTGITASNMVCIGQFTTDGYVNLEIPVRIGTAGVSTMYVVQLVIAGDQVLTNLLRFNNEPVPAAEIVSFSTDRATYNKGESAVLSAEANNADRVDFLANGSVVFSDNAAPYTYNWPVAGTSATVQAIAYNSSSSDASDIINLTIIDAEPTTVTLNSPTGTINLSATTITATAFDITAGEEVTQVEFLDGTTSLGIDNTVAAGNAWSIAWNPTAGTHNLTARATNSLGTTTSAVVVVNAVNSLPSVAITAPAVAGFDLVIGNDTTIVATASDIDGTITGVAFLVNGIVAATDATAPYEFNYVSSALGTVNITARATDNAGGQTTTAVYSFDVVAPVGGPVAQVISISDFCSSSSVFCLPIHTTGSVTNVIGYDIDILYNSADVTPTGLVIPGEVLIADLDYVTPRTSVIGDSVLRISLSINGTAPAGSSFNGNGLICCAQFSRNISFGNTASTTFELPYVAESYGAYTNQSSGFLGTYSTITETAFNGSLSFWSDNSPIAYVSGVNAITNINSVSSAYSVNPDANGEFMFNIALGGTQIEIERDVDNAFNVQSVISGQDAYLTARVALGNTGFNPQVYQIIAMDVNRDGLVTSGDVTQIQQRTVANIGQFAQAGTGVTDWLFVPYQTVLNDLSYRISANYPLSDGIGYDRFNVPTVSDIIDLPVENASTCPIIGDENYKGILLGDVTGNYASQPNSVQLKSAGTNGFDVKIAETANNTYVMSVSIANTDNVNSYDLRLGYNSNVNVSDFINKNSFEGTYTNTGVNYIAMTGYTSVNNFKNGEVASVTFTTDQAVDFNSIEVLNSAINEVDVISKVSAVDAVTDVQQVLTSTDVKLYPVPASSELTVEVSNAGSIQITDLSGKSLTSAIVVNANERNIVNISNLSTGFYLMKVEINGMTAVRKFEVRK